MSRRRLGIALMAVGLLMTAGSVVMLARQGPDADPRADTTGQPSDPATVTTSGVSAYDSESRQSVPATTSVDPIDDDQPSGPPTSTESSTTTSTEPAETLEEFIAAFGVATETDDFGFVWDRLHPVVIERAGGDEDLCRSWVEREILAVEGYALVEVTGGPLRLADVDDVYTASIVFTFQGEQFETVGQYVLLDGRFLWLGECR